MNNYSYIIIDDNPESVSETKAIANRFGNLHFLGSADNYDEGLDMILEKVPAIIFLEIEPENSESNLSLRLVGELYRYLKDLPKIIVTTRGQQLAFEAIKHQVSDYLVKPFTIGDLRKAILKIDKVSDISNVKPEIVALDSLSTTVTTNFEKESSIEPPIILPFVESPTVIESEVAFKEDKPLTICVKSYGDYRFINAADICYLQADNNSTDIHLNNGEMITAFKTLKHFETVLESPFVRIHNSHIVNIDYVSRIHTGNAVCYIKNTTIKLPFSKSYKENVDAILKSMTKGNYLEI